VKQATENLARFLDSLSVISRRENLRLHDRAQLAAMQEELRSGQSTKDVVEVRVHLERAVAAAHTLYGRDAQLDAYLRVQRHFPLGWLAESEVRAEFAKFTKLVGALPVP
jgi:hypothetical protein